MLLQGAADVEGGAGDVAAAVTVFAVVEKKLVIRNIILFQSSFYFIPF